MPGLGEAGASNSGVSPNLHRVKASVSRLTAEDQWLLIYHLIHERLGDDPQHGAALTDPDGQTYLFLVPPRLMESAVAGEAESEQLVADETEFPTPMRCDISSDDFLAAINGAEDTRTIACRLDVLAREAG